MSKCAYYKDPTRGSYSPYSGALCHAGHSNFSCKVAQFALNGYLVLRLSDKKLDGKKGICRGPFARALQQKN